MLKNILRSASAFVCAFAAVSFLGSTANASTPLFPIDEIYSNSDGSVQFIMMNNTDSTSLAGRTLVATNGLATHTFVFPNDLPTGAINHTFLVATQGFADLNLVTPDFVVPNGFLFYPNGTVTIGAEDFRYSGLSTDGVHAFWGDPDLDRIDFGAASARNFAGREYGFYATPDPNFAFGGLWWNSPAGSEAGWGIAVEYQGDVVFAAWATYDSDGSPIWFVIPRAVPHKLIWAMDYPGPNPYEGAMYRMTGPPLGTGPFDPSKVTATQVAVGAFDFDDTGDSLFMYGTNPYNGEDTRYKSITHQIFADPVPVCAQGSIPGATPNFQGMWWNPAEPGWGLYIAHQGDILFAVWFTYDEAGKATWFTVTASKTASNTYAGSIVRTTGPSFAAMTYDTGAVTATEVGTATLTFSDRGNGTFSSIVNGVAQNKSITRQVFADPPTVCN